MIALVAREFNENINRTAKKRKMTQSQRMIVTIKASLFPRRNDNNNAEYRKIKQDRHNRLSSFLSETPILPTNNFYKN